MQLTSLVIMQAGHAPPRLSQRLPEPHRSVCSGESIDDCGPQRTSEHAEVLLVAISGPDVRVPLIHVDLIYDLPEPFRLNAVEPRKTEHPRKSAGVRNLLNDVRFDREEFRSD